VKWSEALLSVVVAVATIAIIVGVSVLVFLNPVWVGFEQDRSGAAEAAGFSSEETREVTTGILSDLVLGPPAFAQTVDGEPVFDDRERSHLEDVRSVFSAFGIVVLLAAVVLIGARLASRGAPWFRRAAGLGATVLFGAVIVGGVVSLVAFDQAFETFHELFFAGGTYLFDPATDRLVQLFPIQFWEETTLALGLVIVIVATIVAWLGLRRQGTTR
jgi:integral membrane protein (TIGR01906 family)